MPDDVYASALLVVKEIREPNLALLSCAIRRYSNLARPSDVIVSHIKKTYFYPTTYWLEVARLPKNRCMTLEHFEKHTYTFESCLSGPG